MSTAPMLLRRLLESAGGPDESGYVLVLECDGLEDLPQKLDTARGPYTVHRPETEIGLRHLIWTSGGAPFIAVVSEELALRLPADLLRGAQNGRTHALAVDEILSAVLGVQVRGAEEEHLQELSLRHLERLSQILHQRTVPSVVDRRLLVEMLLAACLGEEVEGRPPGELLAGWLNSPPDWDAATRKLVREALCDLHGDTGRVLSWALEDNERLEALAVRGALLTVKASEVPKEAWGPLWEAAQQQATGLGPSAVRRVVKGLVLEVFDQLDEERATMLLERADAEARRTLTPTVLRESPLLPLAFADRCAELARRAAQGQAIPDVEIHELGEHRAARHRDADLELLSGVALLSRYLEAPTSAGETVGEMVTAYQRNGAFADMAALKLRRAMAGTSRYLEPAARVLEAYRKRRDQENLAFARALAENYEAALHGDDVVPLHRLSRWIIAPLLEADPEATVYMAVLDGCSYPVFLELLDALCTAPGFRMGAAALERRWSRKAGMKDEEGLTGGEVRGIPSLAPLPTMTSHARGALMLGELPDDPLVPEAVYKEGEAAQTDRARFKQNSWLGEQKRRLFLKGDLADSGAELFAALEDHDLPVVAAVFNAVDDQIGSVNTGAEVRISPGDIRAFVPSLRAALRAGRRVLLVSDHGHTPFVSKEGRAGKGTTHRYLELGKGQQAPEGFLEIDLKELGGKPARRAFAWRMGAYLGKPQVGFHGGCSLEEMVVPVVWIVRDGLQANEPPWWYGGAAEEQPQESTEKEATVPPPVVPKMPQPPSRRQAELFNPVDHVHKVGLGEEMLEALDDDHKAVLALLQQNGTARVSELAAQLGRPAGRISFLMAKLRKIMAKGGAPRFSQETLPDGETLYRYLPPGEK